MEKNYQKILNNIGETYKNYIEISLDESDFLKVNIILDEFAGIKLQLKNATNDISENLNQEIRNLSSMSFLEIKEVENGYLFSILVGNKRRKDRFTYFCSDVEFDMEFYDYSKIEISQDEIIDNYRVVLAVKEARNLLEKHALLGDEGINEKEKSLIKNAMLIVLLNSSQFYEVYNEKSICDIYDLFLKYNDRYEKKEFLEAALDACKPYEGEIEEIEALENTIKSYLDIQDELDKNIKNTKSFDFEKFQKDIEKYQDKCYYYKPMYKIYADFSINIKKACEGFKDRNKAEKTQFSIDMEKYIYEKILSQLKENGFEGEFPNYRYKDDKKIYMLSFKIKNDKVVIESGDRKISSKKMKSLLQNIDYVEMNLFDLDEYFYVDCKKTEEIDVCVEDVLDDLEIHKDMSKLRQEIRDILNEEDEVEQDQNNDGFINKIFSIFKKKN